MIATARRSGWRAGAGRSWPLPAAVLLVPALAALLGGVAHVAGGGAAPAAPHATGAQLRAYTAAVRPIFSSGGELTELQMKPSIGDFEGGRISGGELADRAAGWQRSFTRLEAGLAAVAVPPGLGPGQADFERALTGYGTAARWLAAAGGAADPALRAADLRLAIAAAEAADRDFDAGAAQVQAQLAKAGLPRDPDLPGGGS